MPELPDQMTGQGLRDLLDRYRRDLQGAPELQYDAPRLAQVRGGRVLRAGGGAVEVAPDLTLAGEAGLVIPRPVVRLVYERPRRGQRAVANARGGNQASGLHTWNVDTTPGRLLSVDGMVQVHALEGPSPSAHTFTFDPQEGGPLVLEFLAETNPFIAGPLRYGPASPDRSLQTFEIHPCATAIAGTGLLRYATGHEVELDYNSAKEPVTLNRADASGGLSPREGAIYARFIGAEPAYVRIGNLWTRTPLVA